MGGDICRSSLKKKHYFNLETGQLFAISSESEKPCKCGKGKVTVYRIKYERDFPPFEKDGGTTIEINCPNKCEEL